MPVKHGAGRVTVTVELDGAEYAVPWGAYVYLEELWHQFATVHNRLREHEVVGMSLEPPRVVRRKATLNEEEGVP